MSKKIVASLIFILTLLSTLVGTAFAWFYFSSSQNVIIDTDAHYDIDFELYRLDLSTNLFVQVNDDDGDEETEDSDSDHIIEDFEEISFYRIGSLFYSDVISDLYYAMVLTYPDNTFRDGYVKAVIDSYLCSSISVGSTPRDDQLSYLSLSYAVASDCTMDVTSSTCSGEAKTTNYTQLTYAVNQNTKCDDPHYYEENELVIDFTNLNSSQYRYIFQDENNNEKEYCKIIVFLKVQTVELSSSMVGTSLSEINISNYYIFDAVFRSVPYKDDNLTD